MKISFIKGNDHEEIFRFKSFTGSIEEVFFVVTDDSDKIVISKKLNDGIKAEDGRYRIIFTPDDTKNLDYDVPMNYGIAIITNGLRYTILDGDFRLKKNHAPSECEV